MTKAELVSAIAEKAGLDKKDAQRGLEAFVSCVTAAMKSGEDVRIVGFGNFVCVDRPAGMARNPRTNAQVARPASKAVKVPAGRDFEERYSVGRWSGLGPSRSHLGFAPWREAGG